MQRVLRLQQGLLCVEAAYAMERKVLVQPIYALEFARVMHLYQRTYSTLHPHPTVTVRTH